MIDTLIRRMAGDAVTERTSTGVGIAMWCGESFTPPLRMEVTDAQVEWAVRSYAAGLEEEAGWWLLITRIDEAIRTRRAGETALRLDREGVIAGRW
ncbi:hypothetical protein [Actinoplanes sp. NPDC051851]|uniref:hypothetical protein n=1 Tax=Actinoplanes sp. NPDC051851 TaxID=3154753 RepID=UPI003436B41D